ncbi:DoxX family protein [Gallibacterium trehalosifermentans]|uniref:DoxX family protein n=1 Tax=Gallibacterium trehalosifermentans TaxID=516935 RepID=A0ABV6H0Z6_9PAST
MKKWCEKVPYSAIALLARITLASIFWLSAQTKTETFVFNFLTMSFQLGLPVPSESAFFLFQNEYNLPLLNPNIAAWITLYAEHIFAALLLLGIATRFAALGLFGITIVIQFFVYPEAYALHFSWIVMQLILIKYGSGIIALDPFIAKRINNRIISDLK